MAFLNNFFIEPDGTHVEGEFQAEKTFNPKLRRRIMAQTPAGAKQTGRRLHLRADWEEIKVGRMVLFVERKFLDHPELLDRLRDTGDAYIIEGNSHGDTFWGMVKVGGQWVGRNELGLIIMRLRGVLTA